MDKKSLENLADKRRQDLNKVVMRNTMTTKGKVHELDAHLSYIFSENINLCCEFRVYTSYDNYYISLKDDIVSNAHKVSGLKLKRAIPKQIFHRFTSIILGNYMFDCPLDYKIYLESQARYGKDSIDGNPIRDCKPGVIVLYDDFI